MALYRWILVLLAVAAAAQSRLDNLLAPQGGDGEVLDFRRETAAKLRRLGGDWLEHWRLHVPAYAAPAPAPAPAPCVCNASSQQSQWSPLQEEFQPSGDPFRPSHPLAAPAVPPCHAVVRFPPGSSFQLQFTPPASALDPTELPPWIVSAEDGSQQLTRPSGSRTCLWTLRAPPGWHMTLSVTRARWGPARGCSEGAVRVHSQDASGDLKQALSLCAPSEQSASASVESDAAVLSARLPTSATFTLSVYLAAPSPSPPLDGLQPPPPQWGPYPWSSSHVDVESVHLTHENATSATPSGGGTLEEPSSPSPNKEPEPPASTTETPPPPTSSASQPAGSSTVRPSSPQHANGPSNPPLVARPSKPKPIASKSPLSARDASSSVDGFFVADTGSDSRLGEDDSPSE